MPNLKKIARYKEGHWLLLTGGLLLLIGFVSIPTIMLWPAALLSGGICFLWLWFQCQNQPPYSAPADESTPQSMRDYFHMVDKSAIGLAHVAPNGFFLTANPYFQTLSGYTEDELTQRTIQSLFNKNDPDSCCSDLVGSDLVEQLGGPGMPSFASRRLQHKSGQEVWVKITYSQVYHTPTQEECLILTIQDISDLKHTETLLTQSEQRFRIIVESMSEEISVWMATPEFGEILYVNEGYERLWGNSRQSLNENPLSFAELIHPDDRDRVLEIMTTHEHGQWNLDYRIIRNDGQLRYVHDVGTGIYEEGRLLYMVGTAVDRTSLIERQNMLGNSLQRLKEAYAHLEDSSRRDGLTGILNRSAILSCLERARESFRRYGIPATLVFIDLNRFKQVNDSHGHVVGDQTLVAVVNHLKRNIRQTDDISRYGGDEFVVLLNNSNESQAEEFCHRVGQEVSLSLPGQRVIRASMSFGISELRPNIRDSEHWIDEADSLMYGDKAQIQ